MPESSRASNSSTSTLNYVVPYQATDIHQLLKTSRHSTLAQRYVVSGGQSGNFLLWIAPTSEHGQLSTDQANDWALEFLSRNHRHSGSLLATFKDTSEFEAKDEKKQVSRVLVLSRITETTLHTTYFSSEEERLIRDHPSFGSPEEAGETTIFTKFGRYVSRWIPNQKYHYLGNSQPERTPWQKFRLTLAGLSGAIIALLIVVFVIGLARGHAGGLRSGIWMRYDTQNSKGPRYQLQFNRHNVTEWATPEGRARYTDNTEWEFRIDDQAMIPAHLYTPEEDRYQEWFKHRYPEKEEVRAKKLYLDQGFLSDPYAIQVPSDETFHTAHCVLALRRYWWAKESGTHVCPRDIDYRHMKHCLDSLDEIAFPGGLRGPVEHPPEPDDTVLIWKTKVCF